MLCRFVLVKFLRYLQCSNVVNYFLSDLVNVLFGFLNNKRNYFFIIKVLCGDYHAECNFILETQRVETAFEKKVGVLKCGSWGTAYYDSTYVRMYINCIGMAEVFGAA